LLRESNDGHIRPIMMSELEKIAEREKEIAKQISELQKEAGELSVARKVLARFSNKRSIPRVQLNSRPNGVPKLGPPRPEGAPTTFEMTEGVLADAEKAGKDGLTGREVVDAIRDKYWPGLNSGQVLPIIYGFVKAERLGKSASGKFKRLKKAEE
jgi:hypothetical protein